MRLSTEPITSAIRLIPVEGIGQTDLSKAGIHDLGGSLFIDRNVLASKGIRSNRYIEVVGVSTPTTPNTGIARVYLSSTTKQVCAVYDDGSTGCMSSSATSFLTTSSAAATYLQISSATATYLQLSSATATYLAQSSAALTYITISSATTYLPQSSATVTYLTQSSASVTYAYANNVVTVAGTNTFTGADVFNGSTIHKGTTSITGAPVGYVGEYVSSAVTTAVNFPNTGQFGDLAMVTLSTGNWFVRGTLLAGANGATVTDWSLGISSYSGTSFTNVRIGDNELEFLPPTAAANSSGMIANVILTTATVNFYFKYEADYTVATPKARGRIEAFRYF